MSLLILLLIIGVEATFSLREKLHNKLANTLQNTIQNFDNQSTLNSYIKIIFFTLLPTAIIGFILIGLYIYANNNEGLIWLIINLIYITISIIVILCSLNNSYLILSLINYLNNSFGFNLNSSNNYINNIENNDIILTDENNNSNYKLEQLINNNLNFFAVIFWYLAFNPAISLLYCLLEILAANTFDIKTRATATKFLHILSWIPARTLGITLVFMGSFEHSFKILKSYLLDFDTNAYEVIYKIIINDKETNITDAIITNINNLYLRSIILWLFVLTFYLYIKY